MSNTQRSHENRGIFDLLRLHTDNGIFFYFKTVLLSALNRQGS